jgi:hypothetical protein
MKTSQHKPNNCMLVIGKKSNTVDSMVPHRHCISAPRFLLLKYLIYQLFTRTEKGESSNKMNSLLGLKNKFWKFQALAPLLCLLCATYDKKNWVNLKPLKISFTGGTRGPNFGEICKIDTCQTIILSSLFLFS